MNILVSILAVKVYQTNRFCTGRKLITEDDPFHSSVGRHNREASKELISKLFLVKKSDIL